MSGLLVSLICLVKGHDYRHVEPKEHRCIVCNFSKVCKDTVIVKDDRSFKKYLCHICQDLLEAGGMRFRRK